MKRLALMIPVLALILTVGCGPQHNTEQTMIGWAQALNLHLATGAGASSYSFPRKLEEVDEELLVGVSTQDAWGKDFSYRRIRDDLYQLISAGPDGVYGNSDDIVMENAKLKKADEIYSKLPFKS